MSYYKHFVSVRIRSNVCRQNAGLLPLRRQYSKVIKIHSSTAAYNICSDCILVPSLSRRFAENPNELTELIAHSVKLTTGSESSHLAKIVADVIKKRLPKDYPWPGNVRELAQCVRRVIIKRDYTPEASTAEQGREAKLTAEDLINHYCAYLYDKYQTYQKVAEITKLDRRTVKKHIKNYSKNFNLKRNISFYGKKKDYVKRLKAGKFEKDLDT